MTLTRSIHVFLHRRGCRNEGPLSYVYSDLIPCRQLSVYVQPFDHSSVYLFFTYFCSSAKACRKNRKVWCVTVKLWASWQLASHIINWSLQLSKCFSETSTFIAIKKYSLTEWFCQAVFLNIFFICVCVYVNSLYLEAHGLCSVSVQLDTSCKLLEGI